MWIKLEDKMQERAIESHAILASKILLRNKQYDT